MQGPRPDALEAGLQKEGGRASLLPSASLKLPASSEAHARSQAVAESTLEAGGLVRQGATCRQGLGGSRHLPRFRMMLSLHKEHSRSNMPAVYSALGS